MDLITEFAHKRLKLLLNDDTLVEKYIERFGTKLDVKNLKEVRKVQAKAIPYKSGSGDDPTYQIKVKCPVCLFADLPSYELKAKSQAISYDRFLVPRYQGAQPFCTVNYSMISVTVCPRCLFASPDKRDFITFSQQTKTESKSSIGPLVLKQLQDTMAARKALIPKDAKPEVYFGVPRGFEAVIDSFRLSIARAKVEAEFDWPYARYKAGMAFLKMAILYRDSGLSDEDYLRQALESLETSFRRSEAKNLEIESQIAYIVAALSLRLNQIDRFQGFLSALDKLKQEATEQAKTNPAIKVTSVEQMGRKAKDLWVDRESPDLWKH